MNYAKEQFKPSPIPANYREITLSPLTSIQLQSLKEEYDLSNSVQRKLEILKYVGEKALQNGDDGSKIFHIHRWTNAKRFKMIENQSHLTVLRCRRCELMKSVELYTERDKSGRVVVRRLDRYVEPLATDSSTLSASKESDNK